MQSVATAPLHHCSAPHLDNPHPSHARRAIAWRAGYCTGPHPHRLAFCSAHTTANHHHGPMTHTATEPTAPAAIVTDGDLPAVGAYVACLAAYNNGTLHGYWIDLSLIDSTEEIDEAIAYVIATSPEPGAEEYAVHDYSGLPSFLTRSEWPTWADVIEYLATLDVSGLPVPYQLLCEDHGEVVTHGDFCEAYQGSYKDGEDFAYSLAEDLGHDIDGAKWPFSCIDWASAWRELEMSDYWGARGDDGDFHVFLRV